MTTKRDDTKPASNPVAIVVEAKFSEAYLLHVLGASLNTDVTYWKRKRNAKKFNFYVNQPLQVQVDIIVIASLGVHE